MNLHAVYHLTEAPYAYGKNNDILVVRLRVAKDNMKRVTIMYKDRYSQEDVPHKRKDMIKKESTTLFDFYEVELELEEKRFRYIFELESNNKEIMYYGEIGFSESLHTPKEKGNFQFPYLCEQDVLEGVEWGAEGIVYQIFPDRFYNGDKSNDPKGIQSWGEKPTRENMFGGDLEGIIQKLDYLEDLGVDIIYMTPIFESSSNHKYNTKDYYKIDPQFGDIDKIKELVEKAHKRGMKVILDAVFNHSGDDFFAFKDVLEKGEESIYKDWFYIDEYPVVQSPVAKYRTFGDNNAYMPKFRTSNSEVREYLLEVARYWIEEVGIDGWRLDVCDEVDHYFWREFRKVVKEVNPKALIIGEIMHESVSFLRGDQLDSIMNYPFKEAVTDFFAKKEISAEEFESILAMQRASYMNTVNYQMWNLVDSHDTPRFATECESDIKRISLGAAFQFTYVGTPYLYYGGEIGMEGDQDPDCRRCMIWEQENQNKDLYNIFKRLIHMRKKHKTLVYGDYESLYHRENIVAFKRFDEQVEIYAIFNNNEESKNIKLPVEGSYIDLYTHDAINLNGDIDLKPMEFRVLKLIKEQI